MPTLIWFLGIGVGLTAISLLLEIFTRKRRNFLIATSGFLAVLLPLLIFIIGREGG